MTSAAEIARALGGKSAGKGHWMAKCPAHDDRSPSLSIRQGAERALVFCHAGCPQSTVIEALRDRGLMPPRRDRDYVPGRDIVRPRPPTDQSRIQFVQRLWCEAFDLRGTAGEVYLNARGLALDDELCGRVLRFHPACAWGDGARVPALLARFSPIENDPGAEAPPIAVLRVGLTAAGEKIGRKMLGLVAGAAIKLDADEDVELGLGIAEGLETAMAVRAAGWRPVWALGSAGAIERFPVLSGIDALTIFADHDENQTGVRAAWQCAKHWRDAGREAEIKMPKAPACDWADEWGAR
jgi:putative DNA primase/helicase